jgi:hypothetical protein
MGDERRLSIVGRGLPYRVSGPARLVVDCGPVLRNSARATHGGHPRARRDVGARGARHLGHGRRRWHQRWPLVGARGAVRPEGHATSPREWRAGGERIFAASTCASERSRKRRSTAGSAAGVGRPRASPTQVILADPARADRWCTPSSSSSAPGTVHFRPGRTHLQEEASGD